MSLILEALKKSEANRRLGQAPDLGTPFTPARRERSPVWALLVIVLSLGIGLWWWLGRGTPAPTPATPVPSVAAAPAPGQAVARAPNSEALQQEDQRVFAAARRQESNAQAAAAPGKDEQIWVAAQRRDATQRMARRTAPTAAPAAAQMPPAAVHDAAPAHPARAPKTADMRGYTPPPQPHPEAGQPHPEAGQPHPEAGQPHPDAVASQQVPGTPKLDVPAYYDLPFATRKALPQLSMSMHVYAADPKQRFVILDGARMVEGDTTTDSVTLREIRPDGVILEFQGQRFFFPRDGL
ncbi:MAG TPA: general secretion pathway protein GspB [Rudaea sp.]|nr:general secretion pathway protein GspB [Rudaea sp.]